MSYIYLLMRFWAAHPALTHAIALLLGACLYLKNSFIFCLPIFCLWIPMLLLISQRQFEALKILAINVLVFLTGWFFTANQAVFPSAQLMGKAGIAQIKIKSIALQQTVFGQRWAYKCELQKFQTGASATSILRNIPCYIFLPALQMRPIADSAYWVNGSLINLENGVYVLKVKSKEAWRKIPSTWSAAETRYYYKQKVKEWIQAHLILPGSATFLAGLATGEFDDFWMRQQFARFGLQHLLAISGFHFSILASCLNFLFRLIFTRPWRILLVVSFLTSFCVFIGPQASIMRTWIMSALALGGEFCAKKSNPLNCLGVALFAIIAYDPLIILELAFQLSFAATAAILLCFQPAQDIINYLMPKRTLINVVQMNGWGQHAYCLLIFIQQGLALTLAINLIVLPITLYYFHEFPVMSIFFNLFFPFLASLALSLLIFSILLAWIPWVSALVHAINDQYTNFLIQLIYQTPHTLDAYLKINGLSLALLLTYLCCICLIAIIWQQRRFKEEGGCWYGLI